jgi:hypothetical protein
MSEPLTVTLETTPELATQLMKLQNVFAEVCNAITPIAHDTRCWNRVALHHLVYHNLRERFPQVGSQMVCNAIYSVSRTYRLVFQNPNSPFNIAKLGDKPLPKLHFSPSAPVYFDRHTLSIRNGVVSMYTLDGRMRFRLSISSTDEDRFKNEKLREIVLASQSSGQYQLSFSFAVHNGDTAPQLPALPEYVVLLDNNETLTETALGDVA